MDGFDSHVDGYHDVADQLPRHLRERAAKLFEAEAAEKAALDSVAAFEARRERVREGFLRGLGGLPERAADRNARVTGTIERDGHAVDTLVFESLPDVPVTANLYRPDRDGPLPGVLFVCGHANPAKAYPEYQRVCIQLAKSGFVVLAIDPIGQGERLQYYDPETGESRVGWGTREHSYDGARCIYAGANVARYVVADGMAAVDYLDSLPAVDADRLAVTGNSGGGTQTAYLMLADDRFAAAAPCTYLTSREAYMDTGQAHDAEQNVHRAIELGLNYDDFATAMAPAPVRIGAVRSDFFPIDGVHQCYERARNVYGLYGAAGNVDLVVSEGTHAYTDTLRNATVEWFAEHLQGGADEVYTGPLDPLDEADLEATDEGQVRAAYPDARTVRDLVHEYVDGIPGAGVRPDPDDPDAYARQQRERVIDELDLDGPRGESYPRFIEREAEGDVTYTKTFFNAEPGITVTGILAEANDVDAPTATVVLFEGGTDEAAGREAAVRDLAREHGIAFAFDPRGVGAVEPREVNGDVNGGDRYDYYGTEFKLAYDALMCGTSLFGMRVFDVLRAGDVLAGEFDAPLGLHGEGIGALHALYAAVAEPAFGEVALVDLPPTFHEQATADEFDIDHRRYLHGVVDGWDVPHLLPALEDRDLRIERA